MPWYLSTRQMSRRHNSGVTAGDALRLVMRLATTDRATGVGHGPSASGAVSVLTRCQILLTGVNAVSASSLPHRRHALIERVLASIVACGR